MIPPRRSIIKLVLMVKPHIPAFVHQIDTIAVTGFQHGAGSRIMRRTDGIKASLLQLPDTAVLALIESSCTQDSIVMMHTASPKLRIFPVNEQAPGTPFHLAHAEFCFRTVTYFPAPFKNHPAGIQIWRFCAPQPGPRQGNISFTALCDYAVCIKYFYDYLTFRPSCMRGCHPDPGFFPRKCGNPYPFRLYMFLFANPQPDRAVDPRSGIPAALRLFRVTALHPDDVLPFLKKPVGTHTKRNVTIGGSARLPAV